MTPITSNPHQDLDLEHKTFTLIERCGCLMPPNREAWLGN